MLRGRAWLFKIAYFRECSRPECQADEPLSARITVANRGMKRESEWGRPACKRAKGPAQWEIASAWVYSSDSG
jgi:hypothetical protein